MLLQKSDARCREFQRFGVPYQRRTIGKGVTFIAPVDRPETVPAEEAISGMASLLGRQKRLEATDPVEWGYKVRNIYHPLWPNSGMSNIYYHPGRNEYLKIPIVVKRGDLQFFAMNALNRALAKEESFAAVAANALLMIGNYTCIFYEGAVGTQASAHLRSIEKADSDKDSEATFKSIVKLRTKLLMQSLPMHLRPLCNDNPVKNPTLARWVNDSTGFQNVFLEDPVSPQDSRLTLIDQAHTTPHIMAHCALVGRFFGDPMPQLEPATAN